MISRDFRPRLDVNKMQTNVIMSQIRAQKHRNCIRLVEPICIPQKQTLGRRHFQQNLFRPTDIANQYDNQQSRSVSRSQGKKILRKSVSLNNIDSGRSHGKKKFEDKFRRSVYNPIIIKRKDIQVPKSPIGRKRFDYSPNHQQRQSQHSPLHWNKNLF